jgi:hypothetical protein
VAMWLLSNNSKDWAEAGIGYEGVKWPKQKCSKLEVPIIPLISLMFCMSHDVRALR